ncbi:2-phospho-L-lactate guanylyltransferase (plasmid) [Paraburkholderia sprentiae WSM5005]|uniref:2-phospho-L-lactate guanylyltransferase n=1 Tax=Paraburkholderia sprentiae WSM5005 TaxID=754502 RepID=A0A1I9YUD3_9BURK|nr:2-phospho-L-lactate guanylyltransferase [Paraburkholderia sprentiae]APA90505.1 2-phospho-L-lactate guanylyltransferase [Paraburkholderia sprentiae WSM5005]
MIAWTAVMPFKAGADRKTRLAQLLSPAERLALSDELAAHVTHCLGAVQAVTQRLILSPVEIEGYDAVWAKDEGRGLNKELDVLWATKPTCPLLVVHGDLPFLTAKDVIALIEAAELQGSAIAPDRHRTGTNALALMSRKDFAFAFGPDSFRRHMEALGNNAAVIVSDGLGFDLDTPDDFHDARLHMNIATYGSRP